MNEKPLILVTNDDGVNAPGIRHLGQLMAEIGEVYIVAPDKPQSGMGHAITINSTLNCEEIKINPKIKKEFQCTGTPVDCVKIAIDQILPKKPDLCVSGINHGSNSSINVIYSGTMSAAVEAGLNGIPAIGFSLCDYQYDADFHSSSDFILSIVRNVLKNTLPEGIILNVNIPKASKEDIKGIKICRQARANWIEKFDKRKDPRGREYYWLTGEFKNLDSGEDTDEYAIDNNYLSIVPIQYDLTAHHCISLLNSWNFN